MTTPILAITELQDGQANQFATANAMVRALESATQDMTSVDLSASNVTLTAAEFAADFLFRSAGNTVARTLTVPAAKRFFAVHNNGTAVLTLACGATSKAIDAGDAGVFYTDGTTDGLIAIASGGGGGAATTVVEVAGIAHTATADDNGALIVFDTANDCTVTVPENSTEALDEGFHFLAVNKGGGNLSVATEGSDTLTGISLAADPAQALSVILEEQMGSPITNAWRIIGNSWQPTAVEDHGQLSPPVSSPEPALGTVYLVGTGSPAPSGAFAGQDNNFAIKTAEGWEFVAPTDGQTVVSKNINSSPSTRVVLEYSENDAMWAVVASGFARTLLDDEDAAAMRATLNLDDTYVQSSLVTTDTGAKPTAKLHKISGVIRYYPAAGQWDLLYNQGDGHAATGVASVTSSSGATGTIEINFDTSGYGANSTVQTFIITPDETLAKQGVMCGSSVSTAKATVTLTMPNRSDYISYDGADWVSLRGHYPSADLNWDAGLDALVVTRNDDFLETLPQLTPREYQVELDGFGSTFFRVKFYTRAGTLLTTPDTSMAFFLTEQGIATQLDPHDGLMESPANLFFYGEIVSWE